MFSTLAALLQLGRTQQTRPTKDNEEEEDNDPYMSTENTEEDDSDDAQEYRFSPPSSLIPPLPDHIVTDHIWPHISVRLCDRRLAPYRSINHAWKSIIDEEVEWRQMAAQCIADLRDVYEDSGYVD